MGHYSDLEGYKHQVSNKYKNEWSVLIEDIPYYMHSWYETILRQRFWDMGH